MKNGRRLLSAVIAVALVLCALPAVPVQVHAAVSGTCGANARWSFDSSTGKLTISGTGAMIHNGSGNLPWSSYVDSITSIVIEPGITSIGNYAFYEMSAVRTVSIPDTVRTIGTAAFCWCENLTAVDIPASVTSIGESAFWCCLDLAEVTFHEGLQTIGESAFMGCRLITELVLPETLQEIEYWAFGDCTDLVSVNIPGGVSQLPDAAFSGCTSLKTVELNEGLQSIGRSAFAYCFELANVTIPGSVESIGDTAFYLCSVLETVKFTGNPPVVSDTAFASAVATISYPACNPAWNAYVGTQYSGTLSWQSYSVEGHSYVDTVVAPTCLHWGYTQHQCSDCGETYMDTYLDALGHNWDSGMTSGSKTTYTCTRCGEKRYEYSVSGTCGIGARWILDTEEGILRITGSGSISTSAYSQPWKSYVSSIRHVIIEEGITAIGAETFFECGAIETIEIPDTVQSIGMQAFVWCESLQSIRIPEGITTIPDSAFWACLSLKEIQLPSTLKKIGEDAFYSCESLTELVIPEGVTSVGELAFWECSGLQEVTVPSTLTELGYGIFEGCSSLQTVHLPDTLTAIGESTFAYCYKLKNIVIPDAVTSIGETAFYQCKALQSITIPGGVTEILRAAFANCSSLKTIRFAGDPPAFGENVFSGVTVTASYPSGNSNWTSSVRQNYGGTVFWSAYSTSGHSYVDTVLAPTCINRGYTKHTCVDCDLYYMDSYTDALGHSWNEGSGTTTQWTYTCTVCGARRTVYTVGGSCGSGVYWSLNTDEGVLRIWGTGRMNNYSRTPPWNSYKDSIKKVEIQSGVTSIGSYAFYEHGALETIEVPDTVKSIGLGAFVWCEKLQSMYVPEGVTSIPEDCFWGCRGMAEISLPSTLKTIGQGAFYSNQSLTTVDLPDGLTDIGEDAFWQCYGLVSITIPEGVTVLRETVFCSCRSLKTLVLHDNITEIQRSALSGLKSLTSLTLPKNLKKVDTNAMSNLAVYSLTFPANVEYLGTGILYGSTVKVIHFQGDAPEFDAKAFSGVSATAYYPQGNTTWTTGMLQNYGGTISWRSEAPCQHNYTVTVTPPTCAAQGYTSYYCTRCGNNYRDSYVLPTGEHVLTEWFTEAEPTCYYEGYQMRFCEECGYAETQSLPMTEHLYESYTYPPNCINGGWTEYWCVFCGDYYSDDFTDPTDAHDFEPWNTNMDPTCQTPGEQVRYCYLCGYAEFAELPMLPHDWEVIGQIAPDCENQGYTEYQCWACMDTKQDDYVAALGHREGEPVTENEAEDGSYDTVIYCTVCGEELSREHKVPGGYLPGDINGDGKVNNRDAARLLQYLAGWDVEVVEEALDANGDDKVNNRDAARILQYLAGWDVELN